MKQLFTIKEITTSALALLAAFGFTVFALILAHYADISFKVIAADPIQLLGAHTLTGLYSNAGITLWGIAAMALLMTCYFVNTHYSNSDLRNLLLGFGIISALFYLDDFFMIHERIMRDQFGIPEEIMMIFYFVFTVYLVLKHYKSLSKHGLLYLILSFGFLGLSAIVDTIHQYIHIPHTMLVEESTKFFGISFWLLFALSFCGHVIKNRDGLLTSK